MQLKYPQKLNILVALEQITSGEKAEIFKFIFRPAKC